MTNTYGRELVDRLRTYHRNQMKLASLSNRRSFLLRCRSHGCLPKHIIDKTRGIDSIFQYHDSYTGHIVGHFTSRLEHGILNLEISITIKNLIRLQTLQSTLENDIELQLPQNIWLEFKHRTTVKQNRVFYDTKASLRNKFDRIRSQQQRQVKVQDNWFKNISDTIIPPDISDFLALGPKFSIKPSTRDVSIPHILANIECATAKLPTQERNLALTRVTNILTNYVQHHDNGDPQLNKIFNKTKKFLKDNPQIIVTRADKGNVTVAMNKQQYNDLSTNLLADTSYYKKLNRDPTNSLQQKANKIVTSLKREGMIDERQSKSMMIYNSKSAKFYGLPKIHKPQIALRPIISAVSGPNSGISRFITNTLTEAYNKDNEFYVSDSFEFSKFANDFQLPQGYVLVSLDVVSLFSNIPTELASECISAKWGSIGEYCHLSEQKFLELLEFVFNSTVFTFNGQFYQQIFGVSMGSDVSPIIAQWVMDHIVVEALKMLPFNVPFLKKYVDDIITAIPANSVDVVVKQFNSIHPKIQFTVEEERNSAVPFLDTLVIRQGNIVKTDWYQKPTASGRYVNFLSFHTTKMKINTVMNLKHRILKVAHHDFQESNLKKLHDILLKNSFPKKLLNKLIFSTPITPPTDQPPSTFFYVSLPHVEGLTRRITAALSSVPEIKVANSNLKTVNSLFTRTKDKTPIMQDSNLVYSIPCQDCTAVYIGQTSRNLSARITSHRSDTRRELNSSALSIHANQSNHSFNYDDTKILDRESNSKKRQFLEMVRIVQHKNAINFRKDIDGLSSIYTYLLHLDNQRRSDHRSDIPPSPPLSPIL